ncbi:MAG: TIGR01212 family radical SAM protein [Deltaproteobacteria bacterium]|nr:TIGR01212 family radical SAM protein [Deltaproteobacteria bacterium]
MALSDVANTLGRHYLRRFGVRVHKLAIDAGFTCPNRDGTKGRGGCTFCNNASFSPNEGASPSVPSQIASGRAVVRRRTGAERYVAYFQAYTSTYGDVSSLRALYDQALAEPDVIGLSIGTRPDCVPDEVLDLLAEHRDAGREVWLELGLQSSFDETLERVRRGHDFATYVSAVRRARARRLPICTHLIIGLPGESDAHARVSLDRVLDLGVDGLKLHPLHVVSGTVLAAALRRGHYEPWTFDQYVTTAADLVARTPEHVVFHRLTATAKPPLLLGPDWCASKWRVLNGIEAELRRRGQVQGEAVAAESVWRVRAS